MHEQSVDWAISKNISEDLINLKEIGYEIISVEQTNNSISLENFTPKKNKIVLIFGNEIKGISQEIIDITDTAVEIKQYGTKHSFNVSVTSAICLWEISKSLKSFNLINSQTRRKQHLFQNNSMNHYHQQELHPMHRPLKFCMWIQILSLTL